MICRSELVYMDTSLVLIWKNSFWRPFWIFFENAVRYNVETYQPILLIFNSKLWNTTVYLVFKFEENRSKIATVRVPRRNSSKWPPWRHRFRNFKIREKWTSQISVRSFVENFIKIDPSVWAGELPHTYTHTHTQTHTHTHTHTYIHTPSVRSQHIQSNWLNIKSGITANR